MYSNCTFVNNCKSVGPMRIRQHTLSLIWPTPLFFFSSLFTTSHLSLSKKTTNPPKHQTQFSSVKKIQHHQLEKQNLNFFISLSRSLFLLFYFFFIMGLDDNFISNFSGFGFVHNGQSSFFFSFFSFFFLGLDDSFNSNFSRFFLLLLSFLNNWLWWCQKIVSKLHSPHVLKTTPAQHRKRRP